MLVRRLTSTVCKNSECVCGALLLCSVYLLFCLQISDVQISLKIKLWAMYNEFCITWILCVISFHLSSLSDPKPLPKRALHIEQSRASSFKWEYPLLSLRSSSSFLHLLPRLPVTSIPPFIFPSRTRCRRQFPHKMWPIQFAFHLHILCRIFLCSLTVRVWYKYNILHSLICIFMTFSYLMPLWLHFGSIKCVMCVCIYVRMYGASSDVLLEGICAI